MPLKTYKPHTPGLRTKTTVDFSDLTKKDAEKSLTRPKSKRPEGITPVALHREGAEAVTNRNTA